MCFSSYLNKILQKKIYFIALQFHSQVVVGLWVASLKYVMNFVFIYQKKYLRFVYICCILVLYINSAKTFNIGMNEHTNTIVKCLVNFNRKVFVRFISELCLKSVKITLFLYIFIVGSYKWTQHKKKKTEIYIGG